MERINRDNGRVSPAPSGDQANSFLGTRLRELRAGRRMSQASLASAMAGQGFSWHQQTVAKVENGRQRADWDEVVALAGIFGVDVDSFLPPEAVAS